MPPFLAADATPPFRAADASPPSRAADASPPFRAADATPPFRAADAFSTGLLTPATIRGPAWRRLFRGVYIGSETGLDHRTWCQAAALWLPDCAAVGGYSAAHLWKAVARPESAPVSVVVPRKRVIRHDPRITTHHTVLATGDLTVVDGLPVTTPERTVFDVGRRCPLVDAVSVLDGFLHQRLIRLEDLVTMAAERRHWPGIGRLHATLRLADGRAESPMETRLRLLLGRAGIPAAVPQFEVRDGDGRFVGRVDLGWPEARVAAEYDGDHHRRQDQFRDDLARANALRLAGWTVLRFTADDVFRRPAATASMVAAVLSEARPRVSAPSTRR